MLVNHCHPFPPEFRPEPRPPGGGSVEELLALMDELGIDRAAVFAPFTYQMEGGVRRCNEWICEVVARHPDRFVGFMTVNPNEPETPELVGEFFSRGLVGVKLHPAVYKVRLDDPKIEPFWERADELGLPVVVHTGVHGWLLDLYRPLRLDPVAQRHQNVKIIVEHMGGPEFFFEALAVVRNNPNCYAGITAVLRPRGWGLPREWLSMLFDLLGPGRVIYGTDYPYQGLREIAEDLEILRKMLPPADLDSVLGGNLERLLPR